ncbi:MarR family transcriptional regulator [Actinomadura montaniterrae]|uniref:MarR family transcriptional regulator n=1 Tax=Actinomadura montaniterrae TaxID=1803903 RepID=A0A6L3VVJ6_9ACTN|nr:MarR family transcriptional regulator [Actinomadura montaniterrae]
MEQRWQALRQLQGRVDEAAERVLQSAHGISVSEYMALAALAYCDDDGHLRQQELADAIPLNHSSVSRLVARLEQSGLTERYLCQTDRRGVYTQVTQQGRALVESARQTYLKTLQDVLDEARRDPALSPHIAHLNSLDIPCA